MKDETPRRPGRPPLDSRHASVNVTFRLPAHHYDRVIRQALRERVTVADVIRRGLPTRPDDPDD